MQTPRTARAVVGVTALCVLVGAGLFLGTGTADALRTPLAASAATAGEVSPRPQSFSFENMSPGQTRSTIVALGSTRDTDGAVAAVRISTSGDLGASLSTSIEACTAQWQADVCPSGAVVLVSGWRGSQSGSTTQAVAVPARSTTSLRVLVTLDQDVAPGATGSIRYDLTLQGVDTGGAGGPVPMPPDSTGTPDLPEGPALDPGGPGDADASAPGWTTAAAPLPDLLGKTGAAIWPLSALAGGLIGGGAALLHRSRRRRHDPFDQQPSR